MHHGDSKHETTIKSVLTVVTVCEEVGRLLPVSAAKTFCFLLLGILQMVKLGCFNEIKIHLHNE